MNRDSYRNMMQGLRAQTRAAVSQYAIGRDFTNNGIQYSVLAIREPGRMPRYSMRTRLLSERPRRALAADAMAWAAEYRHMAKRWPFARASNLKAARACIAEASAYSTVFNRLP